MPGTDSTVRKEREVMLRLKEVVDKQRDELRAQAHEIVCKSQDTEAVSAQGPAFMSPPLGLMAPLVIPLGQMPFPRCADVLGGGQAVLLYLTAGCRRLSSCRSSCTASCP